MPKIKLALEVAMKIDSVHYYTDSTIVLNWLRSPYKKYEVFIANRISQILQVTDYHSWNHIRTFDNPADLVTHGIHPNQLKNSTLWFHGPQYLQSKPCCWPCSLDTLEIQSDNYELKEVSSHTASIISDSYNDKDLEYFITTFERISSFQRLLNIIAHCYRFCHNLKGKFKLTGPLTPEELKFSHNFIIKIIQALHFKKEINELISGKTNYTYTSSPLKRFSPFLDSENILRVGGRIKHANIQYNQKFPIILPKHCYITTLIIKKYHIDLFHSGIIKFKINLLAYSCQSNC